MVSEGLVFIEAYIRPGTFLTETLIGTHYSNRREQHHSVSFYSSPPSSENCPLIDAKHIPSVRAPIEDLRLASDLS